MTVEQQRTLDELKDQIEQQRRILEEVRRETSMRSLEPPPFSGVKPEESAHGGAWHLQSNAVQRWVKTPVVEDADGKCQRPTGQTIPTYEAKKQEIIRAITNKAHADDVEVVERQTSRA